MRWVIAVILIVAMIWVLLTFFPIEGAQTQWYQKPLRRHFRCCFFGFLFVTVAAYQRLLGNSSNRSSGMSMPLLSHTSRSLRRRLDRSQVQRRLALMIGGIVCIAAAISGASSQTSNRILVGSTPFWAAGWALLVGVTIQVAIGATSTHEQRLGNTSHFQFPSTFQVLPSGVKSSGTPSPIRAKITSS